MPFNCNKFFCLLFFCAVVHHSTGYATDSPNNHRTSFHFDYFQNGELKNYQGRITSTRSQPVVSTTIINLNSGAATTTNRQGYFMIAGIPGDSLQISADKYKTLRYFLTEQTEINLVLESDDDLNIMYNKPVERMYTQVPSHLSLASSDVIYTKDIVKSPVTSVKNTLTGRLAGLYSLQSSGQPGADGAFLALRGQNPLVIVDGVVANLSSFSLEDVESVTVLKDALGTAMLGTRGSNGALVITTRKGKADKQQISFTAQSAVQKPFGMPETLKSYDYARLYNEALINDGLPALYSEADLEGYKNHTDPYKYPDVDWRDQVLNKTSRFDRYTLNATGGNKFARYFVSVEHVNQKGFLKSVDSNKYNTNNDFKSYVIRSNVDVTVNSKITGGIYLLGRILNANEPGATTNGILSSLLSTPNNAYPVLNADGSFGGTQQFQNNIWAQSVGSGYRQNYKRDMMANFYLKRTLDELTPGLWIKAKAAYYATLSEDITRNKSFAVFQKNTSSTGQETFQQFGTNGAQANANSIDYQGRTDYEELSIGYDRTFQQKHEMNILVLANRDNSVSGSDLPYTISGTSGRLAYNYKGKYVAEAAFGYNGSNRYPENGATKRGFFPAVGLGWNMESEDFMKSYTWLNHLKLFASYGKTGWDDPGYFTYIQRFFDANTTYFGTSAGGNTSISEQTLANRNLSWEKANKLNIGMQGSVLNDRLGFALEYYNNKYYDLLMQRGRNTALLGNTYPRENIGQNRHKGWDARLSWQESKPFFQYYIAANAGLQHSEVLYADEVFREFDWMSRTGRMVGQRFGYIAEGLFQSQPEINSSATTVGYTAQPGDIKYKDLNKDNVIDQFDIAPIGNQKPLLTFGLGLGAQWKGIDFSALVQGVHNTEVYMGGPGFWPFQSGNFGQAYENNLDRWTPANATNASYPRLNIGTNANNQATSSYWLSSGNYARLKNIELGYTLPVALIKRAKLQAIRLFVSGYNVFTLAPSTLQDRDPEVNNGFSYPIQKLFNFGINIKL